MNLKISSNKQNKSVHFFLFLIILILSQPLFSQYHIRESELHFPDIEGYHTLKCDFHTHTVFSDGLVWPSYRVIEAISYGLDVIAITDHIEYTPYSDDIKIDFNRPYEIAKQTGDDLGIIVIPGAEITRDMPPGHLNALFIKDANKLDIPDVNAVIKEAIAQDAFIFWNHPCWDRQQPDTVKIWDIHKKWHKKGYLHGIEVHTFSQFCEPALKWAQDMNLTILSNSDIHSTGELSSFKYHRPLTLVFTKSKCREGVKEALFSGMTLAFSENKMRGDKELLEKLLNESLIVKQYFNKNSKKHIIDLVNISSIPIELKVKDKYPHGVSLKKITIPPKSSFHYYIDSKGNDYETIDYHVMNFLHSVNLPIEFKVALSKENKYE